MVCFWDMADTLLACRSVTAIAAASLPASLHHLSRDAKSGGRERGRRVGKRRGGRGIKKLMINLESVGLNDESEYKPTAYLAYRASALGLIAAAIYALLIYLLSPSPLPPAHMSAGPTLVLISPLICNAPRPHCTLSWQLGWPPWGGDIIHRKQRLV